MKEELRCLNRADRRCNGESGAVPWLERRLSIFSTVAVLDVLRPVKGHRACERRRASFGCANRSRGVLMGVIGSLLQ